jgi:hypothetical protein
MALYYLRPRPVQAWLLGWDNWKELTDKVGGRFHQRNTFSGYPGKIMGWIELVENQEIVRIGDYIVEEQGIFTRWSAAEFEQAFSPAVEMTEAVLAMNSAPVTIVIGQG